MLTAVVVSIPYYLISKINLLVSNQHLNVKNIKIHIVTSFINNEFNTVGVYKSVGFKGQTTFIIFFFREIMF